MSYEQGEPIETLQALPQAERNTLIENLFELLFREVFEFRLVQTDPNFANYLYQRDSQKIVLLDFGATREYSETIGEGYRQLLTAAMHRDEARLADAMSQIGFSATTFSPSRKRP